MKVFQYTGNKQNLFFEPDRPDRFYGYSLLTVTIEGSKHTSDIMSLHSQ